jgi:hypothetical protein
VIWPINVTDYHTKWMDTWMCTIKSFRQLAWEWLLIAFNKQLLWNTIDTVAARHIHALMLLLMVLWGRLAAGNFPHMVQLCVYVPTELLSFLRYATVCCSFFLSNQHHTCRVYFENITTAQMVYIFLVFRKRKASSLCSATIRYWIIGRGRQTAAVCLICNLLFLYNTLA